ncbi:hypothetical protein BV22DRAFT_1108332 [Leucogyrophana mollusca]|uniref:Uncharacterized protein n=1 Tax=Leucogyrophana mollusca TaxID=85980 RepID=A0ACB8AYP7_9AGAM|nr:hypothetical protein BV22DRAFT_1108332 [Leucogyrophana mollusca]
MREGERRVRDITLEDLFDKRHGFLGPRKDLDEELTLKVIIQGEKNLPAVFLQSTYVPHGLLWNSKDCDRQYEVSSMHINTCSKSQTYFWRYRLWKLMQDIVATDAKETPLRKRTPDWFIREYMDRFAYSEDNRYRRIIFDPEDPDVTDDVGTTHTPRHFRTVHKSEVYGMFAAHADWLVTDGTIKWRKLFDFNSWHRFSKTVIRQRREAARQGVIWGWPASYKPGPADLESSSDDSGDSNAESDSLRDLAVKHPVIGKDTETVHRALESVKKRKTKKPVRRVETSDSSSGSEAVQNHAYDSDFSIESTPPASASSDDEVPPTDPAILRIVPRALWEDPVLPGPDLLWWCPIPRCIHCIDMRNLTDKDVSRLDPTEVLYLMRKEWRCIHRDKIVLHAFDFMVSHHYKDHLTELGIKVVTEHGHDTLVWINPRDHPSTRVCDTNFTLRLRAWKHKRRRSQP